MWQQPVMELSMVLFKVFSNFCLQILNKYHVPNAKHPIHTSFNPKMSNQVFDTLCSRAIINTHSSTFGGGGSLSLSLGNTSNTSHDSHVVLLYCLRGTKQEAYLIYSEGPINSKTKKLSLITYFFVLNYLCPFERRTIYSNNIMPFFILCHFYSRVIKIRWFHYLSRVVLTFILRKTFVLSSIPSFRSVVTITKEHGIEDAYEYWRIDRVFGKWRCIRVLTDRVFGYIQQHIDSCSILYKLLPLQSQVQNGCHFDNQLRIHKPEAEYTRHLSWELSLSPKIFELHFLHQRIFTAMRRNLPILSCSPCPSTCPCLLQHFHHPPHGRTVKGKRADTKEADIKNLTNLFLESRIEIWVDHMVGPFLVQAVADPRYQILLPKLWINGSSTSH